jgi:hypothetical protein
MLLEAEVLRMGDVETATSYSHSTFWEAVVRTLFYASRVKPTCESDRLVRLLDDFDTAAAKSYRTAQANWPTTYRIGDSQKDHWSSIQDHRRRGVQNTFLGISAQFSLLPYIKAQTKVNESCLNQRTTDSSHGLFECAVLGYEYFLPSRDAFDPPNSLPIIETSVRLETVRFLLDQAVDSSRVHSRDGLTDLRNQVQMLIQQLGNTERGKYYGQVAELLAKKKTVLQRSKSLFRHVRYLSR